MIDVIIASLPVILASTYFYGFSVISIITVSVLSGVFAEVLFNVVVKRKQSIKDLSAVVTGIILALILPPFIPLWAVAVGSVFATVVVKLFFGGLGNNFMNPAGAAKALLIASWAVLMAKPAGFVSQRTSPILNSEVLSIVLSKVKGNIGEVSIAAILLGGLYLLIRRKISLVTPSIGLFTAAIMTTILGKSIQSTVLVGSLFFAAIFMAAEPNTTPKNYFGQAIFGIVFGIIAVIFMVIGYNPEGPYYAVIFLNLFTPIINHFTVRKTVNKEGVS